MIDENKPVGDENKSGSSLSEVLRLQAVALARMSERMSNQQGSEPLPLPVRRPERREENLPVLASDSALSEESLPVLNTFRKFLEAERRRARRRVIWVSIAFGAVVMAVVGAVAWIGRERIAALKDEIIAANGRADEAQRKAEGEIKKVADSAAGAAVALKQDLRRNVLSSHSILSSNLNSKLGGREADLEQLKEKLSSLEIENAMLIGQLKELADVSRQLQESYAVLIQSGSNEPATVTLEELTGTGAVVEARTLPLMIQTPGQGRAFQLRVPMAP